MRNPAIRVSLVALLAVVLLAGAGVVVSGGAPAGQVADAASTAPVHEPAPTVAPTSTQVDTAFEPDSETRIRLELRPDRDARWEVAIRYEFTDGNQTAPFESIGQRFLDGEIGPDPVLFERFAADASANVERDMEIIDVDREVVLIEDPAEMELGNETENADDAAADDPPAAVGELRLTFVWTEFLAEDGENLELGDAFTTPDGGTWLQSLEEGQTIEVVTPEGYSVSGTPGATVPLRENVVIIEGPRAFEGEDRIAVVYSPTSPQGPPSEPSTPPWTLLAGAIVLAALLIAGGLVGYRRVGDDTANGGAGPSVDGTNGGEDGGVPAAGASDAGNSTGETGQGDGGTEGKEDLSLLSDEERVERLLERSGGRMRQADIVAETGWSDAKVSQLLSAMSDEGRVEKLRLGRENLISVPGSGSSDSKGDSDAAGGESGSGVARDDPSNEAGDIGDE